jgi:hypothetical protein
MAKPKDEVRGYALEVWVNGAWTEWRTYQKNGRGHLNKEKERLEQLGHKCQVQGLLYKPETRKA